MFHETAFHGTVFGFDLYTALCLLCLCSCCLFCKTHAISRIRVLPAFSHFFFLLREPSINCGKIQDCRLSKTIRCPLCSSSNWNSYFIILQIRVPGEYTKSQRFSFLANVYLTLLNICKILIFRHVVTHRELLSLTLFYLLFLNNSINIFRKIWASNPFVQ